MNDIMPLAMWNLPGDTPVYVAQPTQLLADPDGWLGRLRPGDYFVHRVRGGLDAMILLRTRYGVIEVRPSRSIIEYRVR